MTTNVDQTLGSANIKNEACSLVLNEWSYPRIYICAALHAGSTRSVRLASRTSLRSHPQCLQH